MRFSCDRCHKPYSSREDPVPGRVYRIGCRCGNVIVLGPFEAVPPPVPASRAIASRVAASPRRAAPPPLPWVRIRAPAALDERRGADLRQAPGPAAPPSVPGPVLPPLATTPPPSPLPVDDEMLVAVLPECRAPSVAGTLARAARASFEAGIAVWREERTSSRALRAGLAEGRREGTRWSTLGAGIAAWYRQRTSWRTLLAACTASTVAAALLTSWATTVTPRRDAETTATIQREVAVTPHAAPGAAPDERVARVDGGGAPLPTPAAAPVRSPRREAARPVFSDRPAPETDDGVAAPARAEAHGAPQTKSSAALSAPAEASEPAADAPPDGPAHTAASDLAAAANGEEPEDPAAAPLATAASVRKDSHAPGEDDGAVRAPIHADPERGEPAPAEAVLPSGSADGDLPSAPAR